MVQFRHMPHQYQGDEKLLFLTILGWIDPINDSTNINFVISWHHKHYLNIMFELDGNCINTSSNLNSNFHLASCDSFCIIFQQSRSEIIKLVLIFLSVLFCLFENKIISFYFSYNRIWLRMINPMFLYEIW